MNDIMFLLDKHTSKNIMSEFRGILGTRIDLLKERADPVKYFGLFDKHLPAMPDDGAGKKIALIDLSSIEVEFDLVEKYPKAEFHVFDDDFNYSIVHDCCAKEFPNAVIIGHDVKIDESMYNIIGDMKFDLVVGNPPYEKSLHLKILKKTMEHISDDGEVVWLAPIYWLQDPLATYKKTSDYKKYEKCIFKKIIDIDVISNISINDLFGIHFQNDLGVLRLGINDANYDLSNVNKSSSVTKKVMTYIESNEMNSIRSHVKFKYGSDPLPQYFNYVLDLYGGAGIYGSLFIKPFGYQKPKSPTTKDVSKSLNGIVEFKTEAEAVNFGNAAKTKFFKFLMLKHISGLHFYFGRYFPFMQDYTQPWTDERFYEFFGLTQDEIKLIEDTVK